MKFPNAYSGVKKLFTAEIFSIIGVVMMIISAVCSLLMVVSNLAETNPDGAVVSTTLFLVLLVVFLIIAMVFTIISTILQIVGLNTARRDEELFGTALKFVFIYLICTLLSNLVDNIQGFADSIPGRIIGGTASAVASVATIMIFFYTIEAIRSLAKKCGDEKMAGKGQTIINLIIVVMLLSLVATILGSFVLTGIAAGILALIGAVLALVVYVIYLVYLVQAKKMLARAK